MHLKKKMMIKPFNGKGDLVLWLKNLKQVAKLHKISNLASCIPLFLGGNILALYLEMSKKDQQDEEMIGVRLKEAFMEGLLRLMRNLKRLNGPVNQ